MTEQIEIPAEILRAAIQAINNERAIVGAGNMKSETFATLALEAANVGALLAERDALRALLLRDIASNGHLDDDFLAMRGVAALTAEIFSTETDKIEAYSWLEQTAADALREVDE